MSGEALNSHIDNLTIEAELEFLAMFAGLYTQNTSFAVVALLGGLTGC